LLEEYTFPVLEELSKDGLVKYDRSKVSLTEKGHYFIRNVCSAFDLYLQRDNSILSKQAFSKAI
jgi:oxygen-independent coproporphyrinogen-3 oxidase